MKQITKNTILKQGDKIFSTIESEGVIYWRDEYLNFVAQSSPKLAGVPVISLDTYIEMLVGKYVSYPNAYVLVKQLFKSNQNQYTQKDIEKAIDLYRELGLNVDKTLKVNIDKLKQEIFEQINQISVIEVDVNFNIISYE